MYAEDAFIPVSALQHYLFCPRQCALIHLDQVWTENALTAEGRVLHERADSGKRTTRGDLKTVTGLLLRSAALGLSGKADVVEFHRNGNAWRPFPVEYKRGRPKAHDADRVQLCAQALCLEEMLGLAVPEGALFYGAQRRRLGVSFDANLRDLTARTAAAVHALLEEGRLPPVPEAMTKGRGCTSCSLAESCLPGLTRNKANAFLDALRREA